jgi:esterase/lipase
VAYERFMLSNNPFLLENSQDHACLLLHGLGGGVYELELLGQYLYQQGLTVQTINYPGHDHPALEMPTSRWEEWYVERQLTCPAHEMRNEIGTVKPELRL